MISIPLDSVIKDWLILAASVILVLCILEIRKLKKSILQEVQRRFLPQLTLEFISDIDNPQAGFYLKNESFFLAQKIRIEDAEPGLEDFGLRMDYILRFEGVDFLRPQERVKLKFKVCNKKGEFLPEVTEKIIPHLIKPSFTIRARYSNIENLKFCAVFLKRRESFYTEKIEFCR